MRTNDVPINPLSDALLRAGVTRWKEDMKGNRKYACGCVVIKRDKNGKQRLSIFPACDNEKCPVREAVRQNAITNKVQRQFDGDALRLPHSAAKSAIQKQRAKRIRM